MKYTSGLRCGECKREYSISPIHVCEFCFGPLEVFCDYGKIKKDLSVRKIGERPKSYDGGKNGSPCSNPYSIEKIGWGKGRD